MVKYFLVTGGSGYIGSNLINKLLSLGFGVISIDKEPCKYTEEFREKGHFKSYVCDINNIERLDEIFKVYHSLIACVIHLAAFKSVGESVMRPITYYHNNVSGTINLLATMQKYFIEKIVFSSSSSVYGDIKDCDSVDENYPTNPESPYASSKLICENILQDVCKTNRIQAVSLRYFNVVAGKYHDTSAFNLFPILKKRIDSPESGEYFSIYGDDYDTPDGTPIRDYIHMDDLVDAHIKSFEYFDQMNSSFEIFNIGSGTGYSVLQIINTIKDACKIEVQYQFVKRRDGDIGKIAAKYDKAFDKLGWKPTKTLSNICQDCFV